MYHMSPQDTISHDNRYVTRFSGTRDPFGSHIGADVGRDNQGNINNCRLVPENVWCCYYSNMDLRFI